MWEAHSVICSADVYWGLSVKICVFGALNRQWLTNVFDLNFAVGLALLSVESIFN